MTHQCMNNDGQMETVGRDFAWAVYFDDGRSPTLERHKVLHGIAEELSLKEEAEYIAADLRRMGRPDVRVVQVCLGETPTFGIWKVCGGRAAIEPERPREPGGVQVGRP